MGIGNMYKMVVCGLNSPHVFVHFIYRPLSYIDLTNCYELKLHFGYDSCERFLTAKRGGFLTAEWGSFLTAEWGSFRTAEWGSFRTAEWGSFLTASLDNNT